MKHFLLSCVLGLAAFQSFAPSKAHAFDVVGPSMTILVERAHPDSDQYVKFTLVDRNGIMEPKVLGKAGAYSLEALRDERFSKNCELGLTVAGDLALVAAAVYSPFALTLELTEGAIGRALFFGAAGGIMSVQATRAIDLLNPVERYKEAASISEPIITDEKIELKTNKEVLALAKRLELVLNEIE